MCLIALYAPMKKLMETNTDVNFDHLKNAWYWNEDGAGFTYIDYGIDKKPSMKIQKNYTKFDVFREALEISMLNNPDSRFVVHLRNASRGDVKPENCHPFKVNSNVVMCHNGTLTKLGTFDKGPSDSNLFAKMLADLPKDFLKNPGYTKLIGSYIGYNNRLAFLTIENDIVTFGDNWIKHKEGLIHYSNDYFERKILDKTETKLLPFDTKQKEGDYPRCRVCNIELLTPYELAGGICYDCDRRTPKNMNIYDEYYGY